jgi:hypothetical protein
MRIVRILCVFAYVDGYALYVYLHKPHSGGKRIGNPSNYHNKNVLVTLVTTVTKRSGNPSNYHNKTYL